MQVKDHVLLPWASELEKINNEALQVITPDVIKQIAALIPAEWSTAAYGNETEAKELYTRFFLKRLTLTEIFIKQAQHARETLI